MNAIMLIAGAVLNSFWQAVVLAFLVWLAIRITQPRVNAATRYVIWWLALAAVVILGCIPHGGQSTRSIERPRLPAVQTSLPARVAPLLVQPSAPVVVTAAEKRPARWPLWALAVWAVFLVHGSVRVARSYFHLRGVKRRATAWAQPRPGGTRQARLLVSSEITSPIAAGFLHPAVILPVALCEQLSEAEMNCVLLHESAHLERYDDWWNLLAQMLGAAVGLHPVAWFLLRQIEREREMACDDWVVARTGAAHSYAESLARIVELKMPPADAVLASGIFSRRSRLRERIEQLLRRGREFSAGAAHVPVGIAAVALLALALAGAVAPHWIVFAQRLEFEVASVKRHTGNSPMMDIVPHRSGDLIIMHNTQPHMMIGYAYHLTAASYQMIGYTFLPDGWNWYDVDARVGREATEDEVRRMFQSLLEDRFKLKVHRETRDLPEYAVVVAKGKARLTPASDKPMSVTIEGRTWNARPGTCGTTAWREGLHIVCHAATIQQIVAEVGGAVNAPTVDQTGLMGTYDLNLRFIPEDRKLEADAEPGPSLQDALQVELGLKLEKSKGPVEVLVIDHMEKPSENQ